MEVNIYIYIKLVIWVIFCEDEKTITHFVKRQKKMKQLKEITRFLDNLIVEFNQIVEQQLVC